MGVDIAFSDHRLSEACLEALGGVIRAITPFAPEPADRFWAFMQYVSINPSILRVELKPEAAQRCNEILAQASPLSVVLEKSPRALAMEEHESTVGGNWGEHDVTQRWYERLPLNLQQNGKRERVVAALEEALAKFA